MANSRPNSFSTMLENINNNLKSNTLHKFRITIANDAEPVKLLSTIDYLFAPFLKIDDATTPIHLIFKIRFNNNNHHVYPPTSPAFISLKKILIKLTELMENKNLFLSIYFTEIAFNKDLFSDFLVKLKSATNLQEFGVKIAHIQSAVEEELISALQGNQSLKSLSLISTSIDDEFIKMLCARVLKNNKNLTELFLDDNESLTRKSVQELANILRDDSNLAYLSLEFLEIKADGITPIFDALQTNFHLQKLSICNDKILDAKSAEKILNSLKLNFTLRQLTLPVSSDRHMENSYYNCIRRQLLLNNQICERYLPELNENIMSSCGQTFKKPTAYLSALELQNFHAAFLFLRAHYLKNNNFNPSFSLLTHVVAALLKSEPKTDMIDGAFDYIDATTQIVKTKTAWDDDTPPDLIKYKLSFFAPTTKVETAEAGEESEKTLGHVALGPTTISLG